MADDIRRCVAGWWNECVPKICRDLPADRDWSGSDILIGRIVAIIAEYQLAVMPKSEKWKIAYKIPFATIAETVP